MEKYKKIDVLNYVREGIENGTMIPIRAVKFARIKARQGTVGETVDSWSVDEDGNPILEKDKEVVKLDEKTGKPGWIVTKVDMAGNVIIDKHGHVNEWIIDASIFNDKYEIDPENPSIFKPVGTPQIFVQIQESVIIHQWGSDEKIGSKGYINVTNLNDIYGISKRDFEDTYKIVENNVIYKL